MHVASVLGLQVILSCRITSNKMADTTVFASLLKKIKKTGIAFAVTTGGMILIGTASLSLVPA